MNGLEEQADNAKARDLFWKPLSWTIRPSSANDAFDTALWETFFASPIGLEVPVLSSLPRHHNSPIAKCGCKKHAVGALAPLFRTAGHTVRTHGNGAATWGFATSCETRLAEGDLSWNEYERNGSGSHPLQNGHLTHPQDIDAPLHIAAQRKINSYRPQSEYFFSPRHCQHLHPHARRVFASSFSTGPRGDRGALHCHWNAIATPPIGLVPFQACCILPVA